MYKYVKLIFLFFLMAFSADVYAQSALSSSTIDLLKESFKTEQRDTVISGLSIDFATDMLANGASGKSLEQLTKFLGTSIESKNNELNEKITNLPKTLEISNSIWGNEFNEPYKNLLVQTLNVSVEKLPQNTSTINDWIAEKTHNKITSILNPEPTEFGNLYLVNTIYFKDSWETKFQKEKTKESIFHSLSGTDKKIQMMNRTDRILYAENAKVQSVKIPYENGGFMIVYLPKQDVDFKNFISKLTTEDLDLIYTSKKVALSLPKLKIEKTTDVKQIFQSLGIDEIFRAGTDDFINMSPLKPYVADIIHKAMVEMEEEGTTAAAATVVKLRRASAMPQKEIIIPFVADRPFLFFITQGDFIGVYTGNN